MDYDVIVVGGGAAGVGAAVGARQAGARTLLIESGPCLGGAATQKNVEAFCGLWTQADESKQAVTGVADLVLEELRGLNAVIERFRFPTLYGSPSTVVALIDSECTKLALDRVCETAGVEVLLGTSLVGAARQNDRIANVTLQDDGGPRQVTASTFVDASGEGDLAALGGAAVRYGTHGFAAAGTLAVRFGGVTPDADLSSARWKQAIDEARDRGVPMLNKDAGLVARLPITGDILCLYIDASYNALDSSSMSAAERTGREKAQFYLQAIRTIPGYERAYISSTGPKFGTRESRHVVSHYQVSEADVTGGARFDDVIALGAWPMEYHPADGGPVIWKAVKDQGTFDIPLRTLTSQNTANLFAAGRLVDGDGGGGGAMRVMGTSFATGQAAGVAAALLATTGGLDIRAIQTTLMDHGACLSLDRRANPVGLSG